MLRSDCNFTQFASSMRYPRCSSSSQQLPQSIALGISLTVPYSTEQRSPNSPYTVDSYKNLTYRFYVDHPFFTATPPISRIHYTWWFELNVMNQLQPLKDTKQDIAIIVVEL